MDKFTWKMIFNPIYWAAILILIGRQTRKRTYNGLFPGLITIPLGFAFSILALIVTKDVVGNDLGLGWYAWLPAALAASSLAAGFIWPVGYSVADIVGDFVGHLTKIIAESVIGPVVSTLRSLPIASAVWKHVESKPESGKRDRKWFTNFLLGATYVVGTLACGYAGYLTTEFVQGLLANTIVGSGILGMVLGNGWIIAGFAGVVAARLLWQPLHDTLDKAEVNGLTFIWSTIVGYYGAILLGSTLITQVAIGVGVFALNTAIVFPLVLLFFNEGLKKFGEWIKPILDNVYDAEKGDFRLFFHHSINIIVAVVLAGGAYLLGDKLDWNVWLTGGFTALTLVCSYLGVVNVLKHNGGNAIIGFLTSLAAGFGAFDLYGTHLGWLGWLGGVIAGVFAAAIWGLLVLPSVYWVLEGTIGSWFKKAGEGLDSMHKAAFENVKSIYKRVFEKAQEATFHDKTEFKPLFGQLSNVAFAAGVFATAWIYGLPHVEGPITYWLAVVAAVLVTFTSYLVGGKLAKNEGGEPLIVLLCVGAALYVGGNAFSMLPWAWYWALPTAAVLATVAGYGLGLFIIPPVYAVIKTLVNAIPDKTGGWKAGIANFLAVIHKGIYALVDRFILKPFEGVIEAVAAFLAPIISAVSKAYRDLMDRVDRIFGRKKGA